MVAPGTISFEIDAKDVVAALNRVSRRLENMKPVFEDIGEYVEFSVETRFERKLSPEGKPWKALRPSTKASKRNKGRILVESGRMLDSLGRNATDSFVDIGFSDKKALWHQFGTKPYRIVPKQARALAFVGSRGKRVVTAFVNHPGLPARPMLGINRNDRGAINRIIQGYIQRLYEKTKNP